MNATVTATSSFYMLAAPSQSCYIDLTHQRSSRVRGGPRQQANASFVRLDSLSIQGDDHGDRHEFAVRTNMPTLEQRRMKESLRVC